MRGRDGAIDSGVEPVPARGNQQWREVWGQKLEMEMFDTGCRDPSLLGSRQIAGSAMRIHNCRSSRRPCRRDDMLA